MLFLISLQMYHFHCSSLSEDDSSEVDSLLSEESYSSGRNSRHGDNEHTNHKPSRRNKRKVMSVPAGKIEEMQVWDQLPSSSHD